jgi:hypothetical protein
MALQGCTSGCRPAPTGMTGPALTNPGGPGMPKGSGLPNAAPAPGQPPTGGGQNPPPGNTIAGDYRGDIGGYPAKAHVQFEKLYDYVSMTGVIEAQNDSYTLHVDLGGGDNGIGDLTDQGDNNRTSHVKVELTADGFRLITHYESGETPSVYTFTKA